MLFALLASNPFDRLAQPPVDGNDLNPLLQDFAMLIHPPTLYMGTHSPSSPLRIGTSEAARMAVTRPTDSVSLRPTTPPFSAVLAIVSTSIEMPVRPGMW